MKAPDLWKRKERQLMNVKNTTVFDEKTMKNFAFFWLSPTKKNRWLGYVMFTLLTLSMIGIIIMEFITGQPISESLIVLALIVFCDILMAYLHRNLTKSYQKRKIEKMDYTFEETSFQIKAGSDIVSTDSTLAYQGIRKAYETKTALYFLTDGGIYIVSFGGFSSLDDEKIVKETIKAALGKRYIRCR